MAIYTIRPEFSILLNGNFFLGGAHVDLSPQEFELHKHKLEGVESDPIPEQPGGSGETGGECFYPAPYQSKISPLKMPPNARLSLEIEGSFFSPEMSVSLEGAVVDSVDFVSDNLIRVELQTGNSFGFFDLTLNNGKETIVAEAIEIFDALAATVDLRSGGTAFNNSALQLRTGLVFSRTAQGLAVSKGSVSSWGAWVKFLGQNNDWVWNRSDSRNLAFIFRPDQGMIGIGSNEINPNSNAQYYQAEMIGYFTSATSFASLYGNTGNPGQGTNQSVTTTVPTNAVVKFVLEHNGEAGYQFFLYSLPSDNINDWYDTGTLLRSGVISGSFGADAAEIMPFFIAARNTFLILGFYFF